MLIRIQMHFVLLTQYHCYLRRGALLNNFEKGQGLEPPKPPLLHVPGPQLSKPEATAARNQNSIGDRTEKKTLGETRLSRGGISPLARRPSSSIPTAAKSYCKGSTGSSGLFPMAV